MLLAASLPKWIEIWQNKVRPLHLVPVLGVALSLFFVVSQVVWDSEYLRKAEFDSLLASSRGSASFKDWMPIWADDRAQTFAPSEPVEAGGRKVTVSKWQPEHREFQVDAGGPTSARLRTFYYPLWTARAGERALATNPAADGALLVDVPAEATSITVDFREPRRVAVVRIVSILGWLTIVAMLVLSLAVRDRTRHSHSYPASTG
jgi:hypothetical protein